MVAGPTFGRLWKTALPLAPADQVFAQPLVMGGTVFVATEGNNLYALDAESGSIKASRALGPPWRAADIGCSDLRPDVGITGTPVIDAGTRTAYFFSKRYVDDHPSPAPENTVWWAHAVDVDTLAERPNFPVRIQGAASNDASVRFGAFAQLQRPALLLMNGVVYAGFGGHCDAPTFRGWVVGVGTDGQIKTLFAAEVFEKGGAGIWQSGGGLVSDGPGRIFFVTGNGFLDEDKTPQAQPTGHLSQSVVRLQVQGDGSLRAMDFFAPYNRSTLDLADVDFGSGAPVALPSEYFGTTTHPRLLVASGKAGVLYLLDREDLGGYRQGSGGGDDVLAGVNAAAGMWSRPAVYPPGGLVYVVSNSQPMQAFKYGVGGDGRPTLSEAGRTPNPFGYTSGSPIVTSDKTRAGSALVWLTFTTSTYGDGQLHAYDAVPDPSGQLTLRFMAGYGVHAKFSVPGVGAGRIYVGTADGHVLGFGAPITNPVSSAPLDFGAVVVGSTASRDAVITANQPVTITGLSIADGDFTLGPAMPALPASLTPPATLTVAVRFAPTAPAMRAATIEVETSGGPISVPVHGRGEAPAAMLTATPSTVSFGGLARGRNRVINVVLGNSGAQPLNWLSYTAPSAPFSVGTLPAVNTSLAPGNQVAIPLTFAPTAVGSFTGSLVVGSTGGSLTVYLAGSAGEPPALAVTPLALDFGAVAAGESSTRSFTVRNGGGADLTITKSKAPGGGSFLARSPLDEGTVIAPGTARTLMVAFAPRASGPVQDQWQLTGDDESGMQVVSFSGVGQGGADAAAPGSDGAVVPPADAAPAADAAPVADGAGGSAGIDTAAAADASAADAPQGLDPERLSPDAGEVVGESEGCGCDVGGRGGGGSNPFVLAAALTLTLSRLRRARANSQRGPGTRNGSPN